MVQEPRFEDYDIVDKVPNQWKFLGNGKVKAHTLLKDGKPDVGSTYSIYPKPREHGKFESALWLDISKYDRDLF